MTGVNRQWYNNEYSPPPLNDQPLDQYEFDFRTGCPTSITGDALSKEQWRICTGINRARARGIQETARQAPSRQSVSIDVWTAAVARESKIWDVPLVSLERLGFYFDELGALASKQLKRLNEGKEASAWQDEDTNCVYKLFDLRANGSLGQKLEFSREDDFSFKLNQVDATLLDTVQKLRLLHEAGACPTEIVGLSDTGDFLIAKQPFCQMYTDFTKDSLTAVKMMKAVRPTCPLGMPVYMFWGDNEAWVVGDLHPGNIRINSMGVPVVIDALIGAIPPAAIKSMPQLKTASTQAYEFRTTGEFKSASISDNVNNDEL